LTFHIFRYDKATQTHSNACRTIFPHQRKLHSHTLERINELVGSSPQTTTNNYARLAVGGFLGKCKKGCNNSLPSFLPVTSETELYCYFHREDFTSRFVRNAVEKGKRRCSAVTFRGIRQCSRACESDEIFCKRHLSNPKALTVSQFQMSNSGSRINRDHWDAAWNTALYSQRRPNTEETSRSNRKRTFNQAGLDD